eukprot:Hpha_TRINITY_DN28812_c0_g1::TRINITY_DN28812_c0_g1_i1::g.112501::m.112501
MGYRRYSCRALVPLLAAAAASGQAERSSCEGVVKASPSLSASLAQAGVGLPLRQFSVHLLSASGAVKDSAPVSPDGYYALDLGDGAGVAYLSVSAPEGWSVEPSRISLSDTPARVCATDVDFMVSGLQ